MFFLVIVKNSDIETFNIIRLYQQFKKHNFKWQSYTLSALITPALLTPALILPPRIFELTPYRAVFYATPEKTGSWCQSRRQIECHETTARKVVDPNVWAL